MAALAIDQRKAAGVDTDALAGLQVLDFKSGGDAGAFTYASALLLDSEFGSGAFEQRASASVF